MVVASRYQRGKAVKIFPVSHDGFIAILVNESNHSQKIYVDDLEGWYSEPLKIKAHDWLGLESDEENYSILECIMRGDFKLK